MVLLKIPQVTQKQQNQVLDVEQEMLHYDYGAFAPLRSNKIM